MGERALVVEDDPTIAYLLARVLSRWGYSVVQVADGDEALWLVSSWRGDGLVLLDDQFIGAAGESSLELCRRLKSASRHQAQIVLLGSEGDEVSKARARAAGADLVVRKPFQLPELAAACLMARMH
jgi:two-component system phosphate regulon response regulator PhoB